MLTLRRELYVLEIARIHSEDPLIQSETMIHAISNRIKQKIGRLDDVHREYEKRILGDYPEIDGIRLYSDGILMDNPTISAKPAWKLTKLKLIAKIRL